MYNSMLKKKLLEYTIGWVLNNQEEEDVINLDRIG